MTRDKTLGSPIDNTVAILGTARDCLKRVPLDHKLRLLGVRAGSLLRPGRADAAGVPDPARANESVAGDNLLLFD